MILLGPEAPILPYCRLVSPCQALASDGLAPGRSDRARLMAWAEFKDLWKNLQPSITAGNRTARLCNNGLQRRVIQKARNTVSSCLSAPITLQPEKKSCERKADGLGQVQRPWRTMETLNFL